jgi:hypothetical protein
MVISMLTLTVPLRFARFTLRVELTRPPRPQPMGKPPPLTRAEFRRVLSGRLSPHLLRDVGLDDSRE